MALPRPLASAKACCAAIWASRWSTDKPVTEVIGERLPNTLLLMLTAEVVVITARFADRHLFGLAPVFHGG